MRRLRANGKTGARNQLSKEGILQLNGQHDAPMIAKLACRNVLSVNSYRAKNRTDFS